MIRVLQVVLTSLVFLSALPQGTAAAGSQQNTSQQNTSQQNTSRPNIVVIMADDLGYGDVGCYGGCAKTPHIDQLAARGMRFTDYHSNGSVCSPTRAALMTGRYPQRLGIEVPLPTDWTDRGISAPDNRDERTMASHLRTAGYATGIFGKWHLGKHPDSNPVHHGFDVFRGLTCGCGDYFSHLDREGHADWWHNTQQVSEQGYTTEVLTEHAVQFIRDHKDQPFFLYVPHLAIHFPWQAPDDRILGVRKPGVDFSSSKPGPQSKLGPHSPKEIPSVVIRMIESLDRSVGRICETLRQLGLAENTLVVFTSDNGGYLNYGDSYLDGVSSNGALRGQKGDVYEGGHRVPLILEWPGNIEPGTVASQTVLTMDLSPTFLDIASVPHPDSQSSIAFDGRSLLPFSSAQKSDSERTLFWRHGGIRGKKAVRRGPWKLVIPEPKASPELYQLESDTSEARNVADDYPEVTATLLSALSEWESRMHHHSEP